MNRVLSLIVAAGLIAMVAMAASTPTYQGLPLRGTATSTSNTAVPLIGAQGAGTKIYVTGIECGRDDAGTAAIYVTLNDTETTGSGTQIVIPNSGGGSMSGFIPTVPLMVAANTALTFTPSASTTTVRCNAQGYVGP